MHSFQSLCARALLACFLVHHVTSEDPIVRVIGDPVLVENASPVTEDELACRPSHAGATGCGSVAEGWVKTMLEGLAATQGAAIAAPQVGISKQLFVISIPLERVREEEDVGKHTTVVSPPIVLVNPTLHMLGKAKDQDMTNAWERCLSVPGEKVLVRRFKEVSYTAQRLDGKMTEGKASGRLSLLMQHEFDHLVGILMTNHTNMTTDEGQALRTDGLGPVTSTKHLELAEEPSYDIRTAMFNGASVVRTEL